MKIYLTISLLVGSFFTFAQFSDDFEDGNFTSSPTWTGDDANFEVNGLNQLHLNAPAIEDTSYLSVFSNVINDVTWDFWLRMDFNPSSGNYTRVYLVSNQADLTSSLNGYFLAIGNASDEISLYRQNGLTTAEILDGVDGSVDLADVNVRVRVTRDAVGNWEILRDTTGGYDFVSEGTVFDATYTSTAYFGVFCKYTSSRSDLFYFDNLGSPYLDGMPPVMETVTVISDSEIDVLFSEPLDLATAENEASYSVNEDMGAPSSAILDPDNLSLVHLTFSGSFENGTSYLLTANDVEDLAGNPMAETDLPFIYFVPEPAEFNDLIFTEVFPDPNPVIALPEIEFFEIHNRSTKVFDLENWTINDNSTTTTMGTYYLLPSQYVVVCGPGEGVLFGIPNFIEVDGLPTLTNSSDDLVLKDNTGLLIDSIRYFDTWYQDDVKKGGGWTLERKHLNSPCSDGNNWAASTNANGGTPGAQNSIWTDLDDVTAPIVSLFTVNSPIELSVIFNEGMDTLVPITTNLSPSVALLNGYFTTPNTFIIDAFTLAPNTTYNLILANGQDCWGNEINQTIIFGIPGQAAPQDIILNEILFDPQTGGSDYIELYNNSSKVIDLNQLYLANWDDEGISNYERIGTEQLLLLPGEYAAITEDSVAVIEDFIDYGIGNFVESDLPNYPNDSGTVYLLRLDSLILDYFQYQDDFHYALLSSKDGKSLERITFGGGANNKDNWHTASENFNWGTPGYQNSQFSLPVNDGAVTLNPQIFSPDSDGYNDVLVINFDLAEADNRLDVTIYDNQGRPIRKLKDNYFIGQTGILTWDGINDDGNKAEIGTYVILISVINPQGDEIVYKLVTVLAGQL
jgi:hypothetical protein